MMKWTHLKANSQGIEEQDLLRWHDGRPACSLKQSMLCEKDWSASLLRPSGLGCSTLVIAGVTRLTAMAECEATLIDMGWKVPEEASRG